MEIMEVETRGKGGLSEPAIFAIVAIISVSLVIGLAVGLGVGLSNKETTKKGIEDLNSTWKEIMSQVEEKVNNNSNRLDDVNSTLNTMKNLLEDKVNKTEFDDLESGVMEMNKTLSERISKNSNRLDDVNSTLNMIENLLEDKVNKTEFDDLESEVTQIKKNLSGRISKASKLLKDVNSELAVLNNSLEDKASKDDMRNLRLQIEKLNTSSKKMQDELVQAKANYTELEQLQATFDEELKQFRNIVNNFCPILYDDRCFSPVMYDSVTNDKAKQICAMKKGKLANIYSKSHLDFIMESVRKNYLEGRAEAQLWLGMTIDLSNDTVFLSDGSEAQYVRWQQEYPKNTTGHTLLALKVKDTPSSNEQYMWNTLSGAYIFPLCEI